MVGAADGQGEGIGGVFGFRWVWKAQKRLNHFLNLEFAGASVADDSEFGLFRGKFIDRDRFAGGGEVDHPLRHAEFDGALGIFQHELGFDGNGGGLILLDQRFDAVKKNFIPFGEDQFGRGADASKVERLAVHIDHAIASDARARVNPENYFFICHRTVLNDPILFEKGFLDMIHGRRKNMDTPQNILVRMPNWIGDLIMATPVLTDVRRAFPKASITAMCRTPLCDLLREDEAIDELFCFTRPSNDFVRRQERDIIAKIAAGKYDAGILLTNSFSSAWWFWQGKVKRRIGYAAHFRNFLLTDRLPFAKEKEHLVNMYKRLLKPLGISLSDTAPRLYVTDKEIAESKQLLYQRGYVKGKKLIGINPGATYGSAKCWLPERFHALAMRLLLETDAYIVFFGDTSTASLVKEISQGLPEKVIDLAGVTSLRELACLIKDCTVLVTNDSGPMHIAAAFGTPLVALFGSTDDAVTGPYGQQESVINKRVKCSPCLKRVCPIDFRCMKQIGVDEVVERVLAHV